MQLFTEDPTFLTNTLELIQSGMKPEGDGKHAMRWYHRALYWFTTVVYWCVIITGLSICAYKVFI